MPKDKPLHGKARHKDAALCATKYCSNKRRKDRTICSKCEMRKVRAKNPLRHAWRNIKDKAKSRKLEFNIPFELFEELARAAGYGKGSGLHCDRKDATKGYTLENIRFITSTENIAKGNRERHLPEHVQEMLRRLGVKASSIIVEVGDLEEQSVGDCSNQELGESEELDDNNCPF